MAQDKQSGAIDFQVDFTPDLAYFYGMSSGKVYYDRILKFDLPQQQSAFFWGARQTGKSSYLGKKFPKSIIFDLLESDLFLRFLKEPNLFREELLQRNPTTSELPIIVDEVQKVPLLLDEVHWLIEKKGWNFILCGSSARKLKRGHANLLGGRAWRFEMHPLVSAEIPNFNLLRALNHGLLPRHYLDDNPRKSLKAYVNDYLTEEIRAEGLTRNLPSFSRFLDAVSYSNAELVVYSNIASDVGVDSKTVKEYFEILVDTHLGYYLLPLSKKEGRKTISATPKFYLSDTGVANYLSKTSIEELKGAAAGKSFEQLILMEIKAYCSYYDKEIALNFWRTKTDLEVDFVINKGEICIETTVSSKIRATDIKGLNAFIDECPPKRAIVVSNEKRPRQIESAGNVAIEILPWEIFLQELWSGAIL